jgi:hypothetical protein
MRVRGSVSHRTGKKDDLNCSLPRYFNIATFLKNAGEERRGTAKKNVLENNHEQHAVI